MVTVNSLISLYSNIQLLRRSLVNYVRYFSCIMWMVCSQGKSVHSFTGYREQDEPVSLVMKRKKSQFLWLLGNEKQLAVLW